MQILKPYNNDDSEKPITWEELGGALRRLRSNSARILNYVIQKQVLLSAGYQEYKKTIEEPISFAEYSDAQGKNLIYNQLRQDYPYLASANVDASVKFAQNYWRRYRKSINTLDMSIPSFNKNAPILIRAANYKIIYENNNYVIDAPFFASTEPRSRYQFIVKQGDKSKNAILQRLLAGEYKKGNMQIISRKDKWFCLIQYSFEIKPQELDENKILGVDMGLRNAVYWAVSDSPKRGYIPGGEIEEYQKRIRARRISIQKQSKHSGESRSGHGRNRKLLSIQALSEKEANFRNTINHRYAITIVKAAIKNNCGVIQLENLSDISTDYKFLKNWPYYDLRKKIEHKAQEHGIAVRMVDPHYTSQRCSECGFISPENRDYSKFECHKCGYGMKYRCKDCGNTQTKAGKCEKCQSTDTYKLFVHADYNAARNLTIPDIDGIIKAALEEAANPLVI